MGETKRIRVGTALAFTALILAFVLSWKLSDPGPFVVTAPVCIGGKWLENWEERRHLKKSPNDGGG